MTIHIPGNEFDDQYRNAQWLLHVGISCNNFAFLIVKNFPRVLGLLCLPSTHDIHHIFIRNYMTQSNSLRYMPRTGAPHQRVLERLLERTMNPIADILNRTITPHDQRLAKVRVDTFSLRVQPDQSQLLPAPIHHVLDTQVQLATHDDRVGLARQLVQEIERYAVDLVVHVQTLDVLAVVLHDDVDEVVDGCFVIADEDLTVEHLVVAQDVVDHLFVNILGWGLEVDLHATCFLWLEVDVSFFPRCC